MEDVILLFSLRRQMEQRQQEDDQNLEQTPPKMEVSIVNLLSSSRDSEQRHSGLTIKFKAIIQESKSECRCFFSFCVLLDIGVR